MGHDRWTDQALQTARLFGLEPQPHRIQRTARVLRESSAAVPWWTPHILRYPPASSGKVEIVTLRRTLGEATIANLGSTRGRLCYPGEFTLLQREGRFLMSDEPDMIAHAMECGAGAQGNVLVTGLGLGVQVRRFLAMPGVARVDVIEIDQDVIDLTSPHVRDPRVHIHCADAFLWTPPDGVEYDHAWHNIWQSASFDNLAAARAMRARYAPIARVQATWPEVARAENERARSTAPTLA